MAKWLSSRALLQQPRVRQFRSWAQTWHRSSSHAEVASHIAQPERPASRIYSYIRALGSKKKEEDWQQMLAQGQSSSPRKAYLKKK